MTSLQLSEWEAYDRLDPIGNWRDDFRISYLASLLTNLTLRVHGKKGAKLTEIKDFLFDWGGAFKAEPKKQSVEEMKRVLLDIARRQNTAVKRQPNKKKK